MLLLVVGTISIPVFADEDDVNERDDDRDEYHEEREGNHDEREDRNSSHEQREDYDERHDDRYDDMDERHDDRYDDMDERHDDRYDDMDERHDDRYDDIGNNRDELHSQHTKQMTILEDRVEFLEKQIEGKDSIIAEQMKVIMMLVERINQVIFDQIMMPKFGI